MRPGVVAAGEAEALTGSNSGVECADRRIVALEVKLSRTVDDRDVRHPSWLAATIGDNLLDAVVVTTGSEAYRRPDGIAVVPAALLGP